MSYYFGRKKIGFCLKKIINLHCNYLSMIRQPIVSVLGHIDHGKTSLLDKIRGTTIVEREAGRITQHIGATEIPLNTILSLCGNLVKGKSFKIPGLLFIDTPGHHSFITLRARGGSLADLAILVVDINEGFKPQTIESINILKRYKTPFVIALNKIDLINGFISNDNCFLISLKSQREEVQKKIDEKIYDLVGKLYDLGFNSERYDRVSDFTKNLAMVPISAKTGVGIPDLLLVLIGLAQKFLEKKLEIAEGLGEGTILEVREEKGLGMTIDTIIYNGVIKQGDTIVVGGVEKPIITKVKALLKPKAGEEISSTKNFSLAKKVFAASGVKISALNIEGVIPGSPLKVVKENVEKVLEEVQKECEIKIETSEEGILVRADALGSLEALSFELKLKNIPIKTARIGDVSRKDVVEVSTIKDKLKKIILAFNVKVLPDAEEESRKTDVKIFTNDILYRLIEDYENWAKIKKEELERVLREEVLLGKIKVLQGCIFRRSSPAIVGVRVLSGKIRVGERLLKEDGKIIGKIKSIRSVEESFQIADQGKEVAIAIDNAIVGRNLKEEDILFVDIIESQVKKLNELELTFDEKECLNKVIEIKRKENQFWGM